MPRSLGLPSVFRNSHTNHRRLWVAFFEAHASTIYNILLAAVLIMRTFAIFEKQLRILLILVSLVIALFALALVSMVLR